MNSRVQILDAAGRFVGQIGRLGDSPGQFSRPKGVAADSFGHVYVIDALFDNVQIFDPAGRLLLAFGAPGSGAGEFWLPNGIAISRNNEIFVADSYNRRLQIFKYIGPS
ncbi:MAG TPA: 6-bladed beta-propeller [Verrucomicrobiota bacterium]|nr:6-bladed beta-propeller [Verrucomicrobiota bacterium]